MREMKFSITSVLEDDSDLRNRQWFFDDVVLEESDTINSETDLTREVITNLEKLQKMKEI